MANPTNPLEFQNRDQWRRWLEENHARAAEAQANGQWDAAIRREQVDVIPEELENTLQQTPGALAVYLALPPSRRKQLIYWLQSAKTEATRQRRIERIVEEALS
jgi:uncharacterized protein YdeI (YjbR/CyaY-like superfamily)